MIAAPGSPYRRIAASLAEALERLHGRLAPLSDDDGTQRKSAATQRRPTPAKRRSHKQTQKA